MRAKRLPLGLKKTKHNKLMKRLMIIALAISVVFSQMSISPLLGRANAEDGATTPTDQFFDSVKLTTGEGDTAKDVNAENPLKQGDTVNLNYVWTQKEGQQLSTDKDVTIQIPSQFKIGTKDANGKYTADATGDVKLADNTIIGTYTAKASDGAADANKLTLHFDNDKTQNLANASGKLIIPAVFNDEVKADQKTDSIDFDLGNDQKQTVEIAVKAEAEQAETTSSDSKTAASDASSSDSSKSSDASSTNDQTKTDASSTDEAKASDSSSSKDGSSADSSSVQGNKDGADEGQIANNKSNNTTASSETNNKIIQPYNEILGSSSDTSNEATQTTSNNYVEPVEGINLISYSITDMDGNEFDEDHPASSSSSVKLSYSWKADDGVLHDGDTYSFTLPNDFKVSNDINGNLDGGYGTYYVDSATNKVTLSFNYTIEKSNVSFGFWIGTKFNTSNINGSNPVQIPVVQGDTAATVPVYITPDGQSGITKTYDSSSMVFNPTSVTWNVDVNKNLQHVKNATVVDTIPNGMNYQSVVVYPLVMGGSYASPTFTLGDTPLVQGMDYTVTTDGQKVTVVFKGDKDQYIDSAYRLVFVTNINNADHSNSSLVNNKPYENSATFTDVNQPVSATYSGHFGSHIYKDGTYNSIDSAINSGQSFDWTINYNFDGAPVIKNTSTITDTYDARLNLGEINVSKVTKFNADGTVANTIPCTLGEDYTINFDNTNHKFTITFLKNGNDAYIIKYKTSISSIIDSSTEFTNTADTNDIQNNSSASTKNADQQNITKGHESPNYKDKTIKWTIKINQNKYKMYDWSLDDVFTNDGLTLISDDDSHPFLIKDSSNSDVTSQFTITDTVDSSGHRGFKIEPKDTSQPISDQLTISYYTKFDINGLKVKNNPFNNKATSDWYETNDKQGNHTNTVDDSFNANPSTVNNGFKYGTYDYGTKEITWTIGANYNYLPIDSNKPLTISDTITDNQIFNQDFLNGLVVKEITLKKAGNDQNLENNTPSTGSLYSEGSALIKDTDYEITSYPTADSPNTPLVIKIHPTQPVDPNNPVAYLVQFKTSLNGQEIQKDSYSNSANITVNDQTTTVSGTVQVVYGGENLNKSGVQNKGDIDWTLYVNRNQSTLNNVSIKDTLQPFQILDPQSIKVYQIGYSSSGLNNNNLTLINQGDGPNEYNLSVKPAMNDGSQEFDISFNNTTIDRAYKIVYSSKIAINTTSGFIKNNASLIVNGNTEQSTPDGTGASVDTSQGGAWATGELGSLTVKKVGTAQNILSGTVFELDGSDGSVHTGTTDALTGEVTFSNLLYSSKNMSYKLKEISATNGYLINSEYKNGKTVIVDGNSEGSSALNPYMVQDQLTSVTIKKIDEQNNGVSGAKFKLISDSTGTSVNGDDFYSGQLPNEFDSTKSLITGSEGTVTVEGLKSGTYHFEEVSAPEGYLLSKNPQTKSFTISTTDTETVTQLISDDMNSATIKKTDGDKGLPGAKFKLINDTTQKAVTKEDFYNDTLPVQFNKDTLTTGSDGTVTVEGLKSGSYHFEEVSAPEGYLLSKSPKPDSFTISTTDTESVNQSISDDMNSATIKKTDGDKGLPGAKFKLINNTTQKAVTKDDFYNNILPDQFSNDDTLTTGSDGTVTVEGLKSGSYHFEEVSAPEGYLLSKSPKTDSFMISTTDTESVNQSISDDMNSATIKKTDGNKGLPGAKFELINSTTQKAVTKDDFYNNILPDQFSNDDTLTTGSDGTVTVEGLKSGSYHFEEVSAPEGYLLSKSPKTDSFMISTTDTESVNQSISDDMNSATIKKTDGDKGLPGAKFKLINNTTQKAVNKDDFYNNELPTQFNSNSEITTNSDGEATVEGLKSGSYHFEEVSAPEGYLLSENPQTKSFTISATDTEIVTQSISDDMNSATIKKTDGDKGLPGAKFRLINNTTQKAVTKDDFYNDTLPDQFSNDDTLTTGSDGTVTVKGLKAGSYHFEEVSAPEGYLLSKNPQTESFTISTTDTESVIQLISDDMNSASVLKTDHQGKGLAGAEFQLINGITNRVITKDDFYNGVLPNNINNDMITTGNDGIASVSGLRPGIYYFEEIQAPTGYLLSKFPKTPTFIISTQDTVVVSRMIGDQINSATIMKNDRQGKGLAGAKFKLINEATNETVTRDDFYNNALPSQIQDGTLTTASNGLVTVEGLKPGSYHFEEVSAPEGYLLSKNPQMESFTISATDTEVVNQSISDDMNSATIKKVDNQNQGLAGAEFKLINGKSQQPITKDDFYNGKLPVQIKDDILTTGTDGTVTVEGLKTGIYYFKEVSSPAGYFLSKTPKVSEFKIDTNDTDKVTQSISDELNAITLTKVDKNDKDAVLNGAEFKLVDKDGKIVEKDAAGKDLQKVWTTNDQGQFTVNGLAPGKYNFIETKAPNGYELDATPIPFEVTNTDVKAVEITATDKINSIILTKADKNDKDAVLAGAEFKLYDINGNLVAKDANGKALPNVWKTNDQGQFTINGLAPGNYHFIETKAPKDYDLDATPIPFQVTATDVKAIEITATDKLTPGDVRLTKVDRNDPDAVLKGAVFKLTDSNGKTLKTGLTTDNSGQFVVKGLAPGKYFFIETKAPKNYALDDTPISFVIEKGQAKAVEITATDKPLEVTKSLDGKPGATYNVVDENGHVITRGVMADEEGNVNFKGLATGKYHLVLVRGVEAEVQTTKKSKGLPITGDVNDFMTMAAGAILLLGGGFLTIFSRRRKNN